MTSSPPTAGMDAIELSVTAIEPDVPVEQIAETYTKLQSLKRRAKELEQQLDDRLIAWIKANGEIRWAVDGEGHEMVLYLGHSKTVKCRDVRKAVQAILEVEGDWDATAGCLSSSAIKPGAVKKYLAEKQRPELYDELFETVVRDKLESGEPVPKQLQAFDSRFVK